MASIYALDLLVRNYIIDLELSAIGVRSLPSVHCSNWAASMSDRLLMLKGAKKSGAYINGPCLNLPHASRDRSTDENWWNLAYEGSRDSQNTVIFIQPSTEAAAKTLTALSLDSFKYAIYS